jgi:hypothetical protein
VAEATAEHLGVLQDVMEVFAEVVRVEGFAHLRRVRRFLGAER